jgi:glycosyltransferase involved in cell wall biosynthesis
MSTRICYYLGTYEDWGGASRALLNFIVRVDRDKFEPLVVVTQEGTLISKLAERGIATAICPKRDWNGNPFKFVLDIMRSIAFLRRHKVDLIHLNGGSLGWKPPELLAARLLGIPVLMHYHIVDTDVMPFIKHVQGIIAVSRYVADHSSFGTQKTAVVHNIADMARFAHGHSIREELCFGKSDIVIGYLGQIKSIKGIDLFLRLASEIDRPNVRFMIAGEIKDTDPAFVSRFKEAVARNPRVNYIGFRTDAENIYESADILIMPSQWEEPCAMVLFESAAAKKPIIASRTGGTPEIISDGVNGLLFDREDFETLKLHTYRLIDNPAERITFGQKAFEVVEESFTKRPVQELERVYAATVNGSDAPPSCARRAAKLSGIELK